MNIKPETIKQLKELYTFWFADENFNETTNIDKAVELHIGFELDEKKEPTNYISKSIKTTKKEITFDYIVDKINSQNIYKSFAAHFSKMLKPLNLQAYPTTYGIGIFVVLTNKQTSETIQTEINTLLDKHNITYLNEFSQAHWVYRYKISKSKENIERINKLIQM